MAVDGIRITANKAKNCVLGYSVDFLNNNFTVSGNTYEITDPRIASRTAAMGDCDAVYVGQASQNGSVSFNRSYGAAKFAYYIEAASNVDVVHNYAIANSDAGALNECGVAVIPNILYPDNPKLACVNVNVTHNTLIGYKGGVQAGENSIYGISGGSICENTIKCPVSGSQYALAILVRLASNYRIAGNRTNQKLYLAGIVDSSVCDNIHKVQSDLSLVVASGTYSNVSASGNIFISDHTNAAYIGDITGSLHFHGGELQSSSDRLQVGSTYTDIMFDGYGAETFVHLRAVAVVLATGGSSVYSVSVPGVQPGDVVKATANITSFPALIYNAVVSSANTISITVFNSGAPVSSGIDFILDVRKISNFTNKR